jgi:diacylglycerol kinase
MKGHSISFFNAFQGIWVAVTTQLNIRLHVLAAAVVVILSVTYHVTAIELIVLVLTIGLVIVAEMINTSLEFLSDAVTLEYNEHIKKAKDVAAGSVLFASIFAVLIGLMIFIPKIL